MEPPRAQFSVAALLGVVACVAINVWLFRLGVLWGILGLNVTKHVVIAYLCQALGIDRRTPAEGGTPHIAPSPPGPDPAPAAGGAAALEWARGAGAGTMPPRPRDMTETDDSRKEPPADGTARLAPAGRG